MINKNKNKKSFVNMLRKMSIVPVALVALYLFACNNEGRRTNSDVISQPLSESEWQKSWTPQNEGETSIHVVGYGIPNQDVAINKEVVVTYDRERTIARGAISYNDVEQKPVFQGTDNDFRRFLARYLVYPAKAQENGIAGTVVVSFVVDKDGNVTDVKSPVKIDILSDEAERVFKKSPAWKPGSQKGKNVAVQCFAFMEFELRGNVSTEVKDEEPVYQFVENMPEFPGGAEALRIFISKNIVYPQEAQDKGIMGTVILSFVVGKDGSISNAKVVRGIDPLCDAEALRVVNSMPKWKPGKQGGKEVYVKFTMPIKFALKQSDTPSTSTSSGANKGETAK